MIIRKNKIDFLTFSLEIIVLFMLVAVVVCMVGSSPSSPLYHVASIINMIIMTLFSGFCILFPSFYIWLVLGYIGITLEIVGEECWIAAGFCSRENSPLYKKEGNPLLALWGLFWLIFKGSKGIMKITFAMPIICFRILLRLAKAIVQCVANI